MHVKAGILKISNLKNQNVIFNYLYPVYRVLTETEGERS